MKNKKFILRRIPDMKTRTMKTKTLSILLAIVMLLGMLPMSAVTVSATETEDYITVHEDVGDGEGRVYAGQYFTDGSDSVGGSPADNYLYYEGNGKITLKNFAGERISSENKDISITLIGENNLYHLNVDNGKLQISGNGSLTGISWIGSSGFDLFGGTVTTQELASTGDISISGGELTLTNWALRAMGDCKISITGGKVTVSGNKYGLFTTGTNGTVSITGGEVEVTARVSGSDGDKAICTNTLIIDDMQILAGTSADDAKAVDAYNGEMYVKITPRVKGLIITGGVADTDYTYKNGVLDIKAAGSYEIKNVDSTTAMGDIIKVSAPEGMVNITLSGVVINVSATDLAAFEITGSCTTKLILKDGIENSLDSGYNRAGIANHSHNLIIACENAEKDNHICSLNCGALRAIGQNESAGIGGDSRENGSNITITGGNVLADAVSGRSGAGIGGGNGGNGNNITISGGIVTAISEAGSSIGGGGDGGNGSNITISGGVVTAESNLGAGIGGGERGNGSNITISGGIVTAESDLGAGIGGGDGGIVENIRIAPAANTRIYAFNGRNNTGAALGGSPFTNETNITERLEGSDFYSEAQCIHADTDYDHNCDFCSDETDMGTHGDTDTDHACDYGCSEPIGAHEDTDLDHACEYGCSEPIGTCEDADKDHDCDYGCDRIFDTHAQASDKHICDYCEAVMSSCKDEDDNHVCDVCNAELTHDAATDWKTDETNHWHECSCGAKSDEAAHSGGTATCKDKAACSVCASAYGELATSHDYENGICTLCGEAEPIDPAPTDPDHANDNDGSETWVIVLITVGSVIVLEGGGIAVYWFVIRKRKNI